MQTSPAAKSDLKLRKLLDFLKADPQNLDLLKDAAAAAFEEKQFDTAAELVARYQSICALPSALANLKGLIALARHDYPEAVMAFEYLRAQNGDDPVLRFNLAWARAMMGSYQDTATLLDDAALNASPRAPSLKIQAMHHQGLYDEALACGADLAVRFPDDQALMGSLATLAMDAGKPELVRLYAERSSKNSEGSTALGLLALSDQNPRALVLFDQAIALDTGNPRAWVGKGLTLLAAGDASAAAQAIDRGAALFDRHIGSWIASGWAHFAAKDTAKARSSFEKALALDANFSESYGGLAVLDLAAGNLQSARKNCEIALRLDKLSLGGALAKSMLLASSGQPQLATRVRDLAMSTPVGPAGETISQLLAKISTQPVR